MITVNILLPEKKTVQREQSINVILPRGEYTVVVYDNEDVEVKNPAYNSTITTSMMLNAGMV